MALEIFINDLYQSMRLDSTGGVEIVVDNHRIPKHSRARTNLIAVAPSRKQAPNRWLGFARQKSDSCLMAPRRSHFSPKMKEPRPSVSDTLLTSQKKKESKTQPTQNADWDSPNARKASISSRMDIRQTIRTAEEVLQLVAEAKESSDLSRKTDSPLRAPKRVSSPSPSENMKGSRHALAVLQRRQLFSSSHQLRDALGSLLPHNLPRTSSWGPTSSKDCPSLKMMAKNAMSLKSSTSSSSSRGQRRHSSTSCQFPFPKTLYEMSAMDSPTDHTLVLKSVV